MPESRKNPKPEKCLSKPQTPTNPLHAVLGMDLKTHCSIAVNPHAIINAFSHFRQAKQRT